MKRNWIPDYVAIAILLGVAIMLFPLNLLLVPVRYSSTSSSHGYAGSDSQPYQFLVGPSDVCPEESYEGLLGTESKGVRLDGAVGYFPSSLVYAGLASAVSLAVALGAYSLSRRRVTA